MAFRGILSCNLKFLCFLLILKVLSILTIVFNNVCSLIRVSYKFETTLKQYYDHYSSMAKALKKIFLLFYQLFTGNKKQPVIVPMYAAGLVSFLGVMLFL